MRRGLAAHNQGKNRVLCGLNPVPWNGVSGQRNGKDIAKNDLGFSAYEDCYLN